MKLTLTLTLLTFLLLAPLAALHVADSQPSAARPESPQDVASTQAEQGNLIVYYVAADGADTNSGTREQPFATLERARDAIRELKKPSGGLPAGGFIPAVEDGIPCGKCVEPKGAARRQSRGESGTYDITIRCKDARGGSATLALHVGDRQLGRWTLGKDDDAWHTEVLRGIKLNRWDELRVECQAGGHDAGCVDSLRLQRAR